MNEQESEEEGDLHGKGKRERTKRRKRTGISKQAQVKGQLKGKERTQKNYGERKEKNEYRYSKRTSASKGRRQLRTKKKIREPRVLREIQGKEEDRELPEEAAKVASSNVSWPNPKEVLTGLPAKASETTSTATVRKG